MSISNSVYNFQNSPPCFIFDSIPNEHDCLLRPNYYRIRSELHYYYAYYFRFDVGSITIEIRKNYSYFYLGYVWFPSKGVYYGGKTYNYVYPYSEGFVIDFPAFEFDSQKRMKSLDSAIQWCNSYNRQSTYSLYVQVVSDSLYLMCKGEFRGSIIASDKYDNSDGVLILHASTHYDVHLMHFRRADIFCNDFKFQEIRGLLGG